MFAGLGIEHDIPEDDLQGIFVIRVQVQDGVEVHVPDTDGIKQNQNSQNSLGQRQHNLEKSRKSTGSVDLGRFVDLLGDLGVEEGSRNDHVVNAKAVRDDDSPDTVDHMKVFDNQIGGNHTAAEHHREKEKPVEKFFAPQLFFWTEGTLPEP